MLQNVATCARIKQQLQNVRDLCPFHENPVCPDPVWKPVISALARRGAWDAGAEVAAPPVAPPGRVRRGADKVPTATSRGPPVLSTACLPTKNLRTKIC